MSSADLGISFAGLVKSNNGQFKSEKQAAFLLSQCDNGEFCAAGGHVFGNSFRMFYICDATGVVRVQKQTHANGLVLQWERVEAGRVSIQTSLEFKRLTRMAAQHVKSMASRQAAKDAGEYDAPQELFDSCMQNEAAQIVRIEEKIAALTA